MKYDHRLLIFIFILSLSGCFSSKNIPENFQDAHYVNYDKVRITITDQSNSYDLKGFIYFVRDSSMCFKFFAAPFGTEVVRGFIGSRVWVYNSYQHEYYGRFLQQAENYTGLIIPNTLFQDLLFGNIGRIEKSLEVSNSGLIQISRRMGYGGRIKSFELINKTNQKRLDASYRWKGHLPTVISLTFTDGDHQSNIVFDIVGFSYGEKKCNFKPEE